MKKTIKTILYILTVTLLSVLILTACGNVKTFKISDINWELSKDEFESECKAKLIESDASILSYEYESFEDVYDGKITVNYLYGSTGKLGGVGKGDLESLGVYFTNAKAEDAQKIVKHFNMKEDTEEKGEYFAIVDDCNVYLYCGSEFLQQKPDDIYIYISKKKY